MTTILPTRSSRESNIPAAPIGQAKAIQPQSHHFFSSDVETELSHADHEAWTAVCTILIVIVSVGLLLGLGGVLLTL
jgi:hypothetical protein